MVKPMGNPWLVNPQGTGRPHRLSTLPMVVLRSYCRLCSVYTSRGALTVSTGRAGSIVVGSSASMSRRVC